MSWWSTTASTTAPRLVASAVSRGAPGQVRRTAASVPRQQPGSCGLAPGRYVLFLNPDTELVDGNLTDLIEAMDARPEVGLVGVRQVTADGALWPTIRYFPSFSRALGDALAPSAGRGSFLHGPGSASSTRRLRAGERVRLDVGVVHARPAAKRC